MDSRWPLNAQKSGEEKFGMGNFPFFVVKNGRRPAFVYKPRIIGVAGLGEERNFAVSSSKVLVNENTLLVGVAVIAVLASPLLSALARCRGLVLQNISHEQPKTNCFGTWMYGNEFDGFFPPAINQDHTDWIVSKT